MHFDAPRADELPLVYDAWANSFRKSPWAGCIPNHLYDQVSRTTIGEILSRGARVIAAVQDLPDGNRRVCGYSVSEPQILHWLFVKLDYRGMGIGKQLLAETVKDWPTDSTFDAGHPPWKYTHRTRSSARFLGDGWTHDPVPARVLGRERSTGAPIALEKRVP